MKKKTGCFTLLVLTIALAVFGYWGYRTYWPSSERADLAALYESKADEGAVLFLNYGRQEEEALCREGVWYLPLDWTQKKLNERYYEDSGENLLLYTMPEETLRWEDGAEDSAGHQAVLRDGEESWISLDLVKEHTDIRTQTFDEAGVRRLYIENLSNPYIEAELSRKTRIRLRGGVKSKVLAKEAKGTRVTVLETLENWAKVWSPDGHIGYVPVSRLKKRTEITPEPTIEEPVYTSHTYENKVSLVWHQVTNQTANNTLASLMAQTKGVNVVSPTWIALSDNDGSFQSLASADYVAEAHRMGLKVWPLIDNFGHSFSGNVSALKLLSDTASRGRLISGLMAEADRFGFDGFNLDLESLSEEAGPHYIQFIREFSVACRKKGIVLSVDGYMPASYNQFYNRKEQGVFADYVVLMGYDEHYAGGEAGSVSSIGFFRDGIRDTLLEVPKEKIIAGVPFYTRLWTVSGKETVSSKALSLGDAAGWVSSHQVTLNWDDALGQSYGELDADGGTYQIWMEDAASLGLKMDAIHEADLGGVAAWKLGMETADVWDVVKP